MMKKNNDRRLTGLTLFAAVLAVLLGMAGCGENQENAASEPEIHRTEGGGYY